jgi:Ca2+-binding RTX toxin-like protein
MAGGTGDDHYYIDDFGDRVVESHGQGIDRVHTMFSYALGAALESLVLLNNADSGIGNELDNLIVGNAGANRLEGSGGNDTIDGGLGTDELYGGSGADLLYGGGGNDLYWIDQVDDEIVEAINGGIDEVYASADYELRANLENLTLGEGAGIGIGNELANMIQGTHLNNSLDGLSGDDTLKSGEGADTMRGGLGDDTFYVDDLNDEVIDYVGEGRDTVLSGVSFYTLSRNIENLTLSTGGLGGTGNDLDNVITGNRFSNLLEGELGADTLSGGDGNDTLRGGNGNDDLTGGTGADWFQLARDESGVDTFVDFTRGQDKIGLYSFVRSLEDGVNFFVGSGPVSTVETLLYSEATGELFYDIDGTGAEAAVKIAVLSNKSMLSASDFLVI